MIHASEKYNQAPSLDHLIPDDEPVFLIRGHDPSAMLVISTWLKYARDRGVPEERLREVRLHAIEMAGWRKPEELPDAD